MTELLTKSQIIQLINEGKLLPSEIEKMIFENIKEYCIENHITNRNSIYSEYDDRYSALCHVYNTCKYCPLTQTGNCCNDDDSAWNKYYCYYDGNFYEFMKRLDAVILSLDKAIEYEKIVTKIISPESIKKLYRYREPDETLDEIIDDLTDLYDNYLMR